MTSNDIAVPDLSYYIEHDRLQDALREVHEDGQNGEVPSLSLTTVTTSTAQSATTSRVPLAAPKKPKKRPKKKRKKTSEPLPPRRRTPKKFLSPYAVFADIRRQGIKAVFPNKKMSDVWKEMAIEWGTMTRTEKAPYRKQFEDRQRLYELEAPHSRTHQSGSQARPFPSSGFRFAPHRYNEDHEVSRIEHLPHCPIAVKRKVYEGSVLAPFTHPQRANIIVRQSDKDNPAAESSRNTCISCPRAYAVCEYCRSLGYVGARILHFESDCWSKTRQFKDRELGFVYTSAPFRTSALPPVISDDQFLPSTSAAFPHTSIHPAEAHFQGSGLPERPDVESNRLFDTNLSLYDAGFELSHDSTVATSQEPFEPPLLELPDVSVIDDFLISIGMKAPAI